MASVSILGCGWLGFPLAEKLVNEGYKVKGSSTTSSKIKDLQKARIEAYQIELPKSKIDSNFFASDFLIVNIPPQTSKKGVDHHRESLEAIVNQIPQKQKIIYVSSTSVYPKVDHSIDEDHDLDLQSDRSKALIQAEELLIEHFRERLTIIRFGGLLGYDRIPGKYFSNKKLEQHQQKVNYIHQDDAIGLILAVLSTNKWGYVINGVAPKHPTKKEVFNQNSKDFNFPPPVFGNEQQVLTNRIIKSIKIEHILDYSFIYPDPLHFFYTN
ncbi:NAD(P)-binding domain-containing protein [Marivirga harenae]|uniref:NAD(P)-binding domain-containing protein n=1 Tax=Marivirga harenae TaxID=2010992 RepID=UPI0026DFED47|nr:NAD(P)-binding domain-containing protein [Marivirga harenae]WKV10460.1 NAD(P)-binding domain-containing protein [Marivirga harenae]